MPSIVIASVFDLRTGAAVAVAAPWAFACPGRCWKLGRRWKLCRFWGIDSSPDSLRLPVIDAAPTAGVGDSIPHAATSSLVSNTASVRRGHEKPRVVLAASGWHRLGV